MSRYFPPYADLDCHLIEAFVENTKGLFQGRKAIHADTVEFYLGVLGIEPTDEMVGTAVLHLTDMDPNYTRLVFMPQED